MSYIEFEVWENQRLSVSESVYRHDNRRSGDRPAWSTKDGKQGLHREAFLLPDLSWEWEGPWFIADLQGNPIFKEETAEVNKHSNNNNANGSPTRSAQSGNTKGWLYAPSYMVSTKSCSSEPNALSLVRRRRWIRRAKKTVAGIVLPHPIQTIHYGYSSNPEGVALCAQNPLAFPLASAAPTSLVGKATAFFKSPFGSSKKNDSSSSTPPLNSPDSSTTTNFSFSSPQSAALKFDPKSLTPTAEGEVILLLKHQQTFDMMQTYMAELFLNAKTTADALAQNTSSDPLDKIPQEIYKILRDSGIPQPLRAPMWLGFSGALSRKMKNRGTYQQLLEVARKNKMSNPNSSINLDVARTCANHSYFSNGTGPGAKSLRNVLFAYQEYALIKWRERQGRQKTELDLMAMMKKLEDDDDDDGEQQNNNNNNQQDEDADAFSSSATPSQQRFRSKNNSHNTSSSSPKQKSKSQISEQEEESLANVYHQPLSYIASVFVMNCEDEEDAFWLLVLMVEECSLLQAALDEDGNSSSSSNGNNNSFRFGADNNMNKMQYAVEKFSAQLKAQAPQHLQEMLATVDLSICAYGYFQALMCAHVSTPVASRLFDIFLVNVKNSIIFVDFAVALVLKCFMHDNGNTLSRFLNSETGGSGRLDVVSVGKYLNEAMRKVSCDLVL
jgi:hypothetical protein